jgi:hypothetical protein
MCRTQVKQASHQQQRQYSTPPQSGGRVYFVFRPQTQEFGVRTRLS